MKRWVGLKHFIAVGLITGSAASGTGFAFAAEVSARFDRDSISQDESVELKIEIQSDRQPEVEEPQYEAPDLELINQYAGTSSQMLIVNGSVQRIAAIKITHVLRPKKAGLLQLRKLSVRVDGKVYTLPDLSLRVVAAGSGSGASVGGLRGSSQSNESQVFLTTEVSKDRLYKGEQLIVSYYLYTRLRIADQTPEKYPELVGFLKEELEMPFFQGRPIPERVSRGGRIYDRYLIAKYAAYPVQVGKLNIDGLNLRYSYLQSPSLSTDDDDIFSIQGMFQSIAPRVANVRGKTTSVEVLPLPDAGRPASFTGGVGDFSVTAMTDKTQVRMNEALTLKVKVEGRGNLATLGEPRVAWSNALEVYDTQGKASVGRAGVGDKVFDIVLIPKATGKVTIPAIEFGFFDPAQKKYYTRSTEAISLQVDAAIGGAAPSLPSKGTDSGQTSRTTAAGAAEAGAQPASWFSRVGKGLFIFAGLSLILALGLLVLYGLRSLRKVAELTDAEPAEAVKSAQPDAPAPGFWSSLRESIPPAAAPVDERAIERSYAQLENIMIQAVKKVTGQDLRSTERDLVFSHVGFVPELERNLLSVLEYSEMLRYAAAAGGARYEDARKRWGEHRALSLSALETLEGLSKRAQTR